MDFRGRYTENRELSKNYFLSGLRIDSKEKTASVNPKRSDFIQSLAPSELSVAVSSPIRSSARPLRGNQVMG
jgi:hypothetical protein